MKHFYLSLTAAAALCLSAAQAPAAVFIYEAMLSGSAESPQCVARDRCGAYYNR